MLSLIFQNTLHFSSPPPPLEATGVFPFSPLFFPPARPLPFNSSSTVIFLLLSDAASLGWCCAVQIWRFWRLDEVFEVCDFDGWGLMARRRWRGERFMAVVLESGLKGSVMSIMFQFDKALWNWLWFGNLSLA
ncbi:unnamed protein product [Rhodiola kirilowii]